MKEEHPSWTRAKKPGPANWFAMACPFKGGPYYAFSFAQGGKLRSELYIDYTHGEAVSTLYSRLLARRERIEALYGTALSWEELPDRRASRVADYAEGDVANTDSHDHYIDWFFDSGHRLRRAIDAVAGEVAGGGALDMSCLVDLTSFGGPSEPPRATSWSGPLPVGSPAWVVTLRTSASERPTLRRRRVITGQSS